MNKEELFDRYTEAQRSDIILEGANVSGDLGLDGYVLTALYADIIFAEYIDVVDGQQITRGGLIAPTSKTKTWRKARVHMVSPWIERNGDTKVGDIVMFPNDKGLETGEVMYVGSDGKRHSTSHGIFLNEMRLLGKVEDGEK